MILGFRVFCSRSTGAMFLRWRRFCGCESGHSCLDARSVFVSMTICMQKIQTIPRQMEVENKELM
jgi:hypothetical protein